MAATRDTMDRAITFNMVVARFIFSAQRLAHPRRG
jgi:hypothetical protein